MIFNYLDSLPETESICEGFRRMVLDNFFRALLGGYADYTTVQFFCFTPRYQQQFRVIKGLVAICDKFNIDYLEKEKENLIQKINELENPDWIRTRQNFETSINFVKNAFYSVKNELRTAINLLNKSEKERLNEAIHNLLEGCYYSSVAMSVSAIEFRLLQLMKSTNPESKLEEMTLGQLIEEYLKNKGEYQNVIPEKHEPLLRLCNTYRIFSVHPKTEEINKRVAESVLNLTLEFLLDRSLKKYE